MLTLLICASLVVGASPRQASTDDFSVVYRFENAMFLVPRIEVSVDGAGRGRVVFARKNLNRDVERPLELRGETLAQAIASLDRLNFVDSTEVYQSKSEHPNLGTVTLRVERGGKSREVRFNYTENKDAELLAALFRGLATREIHAFDLETAARYYPLDTPDILKALKDDIGRKRVTEPASLLPLLRDLADNVRLPLIARNKAEELVRSLERGADRSSSRAGSEKR